MRMIRAATVPRSAKREGVHEARIIRRLVPFFEAAGYDAVPHARFNIAWGSILSDIDLLLIGRPGAAAGGPGLGVRQEVVAVEVKSSRDDLRRAAAQVGRLLDYADRAYVATDYTPRRFAVRGAGLIVVGRGGRVDVVRAAPRSAGWRGGGGGAGCVAAAAAALPKKCLLRMAEARGAQGAGRLDKARLARCVTGGREAGAVGGELAAVATCGGGGACDAACPVWGFEGAEGRGG